MRSIVAAAGGAPAVTHADARRRAGADLGGRVGDADQHRRRRAQHRDALRA